MNLEFLPDEVVIGWMRDTVTQSSGSGLLYLVSKTNSEAIFEFKADFEPSIPHVFEFFGTPFALPRTLLDIEII